MPSSYRKKRMGWRRTALAKSILSVVALFGLVLLAAGVLGAQAARGFDDCLPSQVRLTIATGSPAFTGGAYPISVVLHNISKTECSVEGHPQVVIAPKPFPTVIGDLADFDRNDPFVGPERVLHVLPGHAVTAQVIIGRPCDGAKSEMTTTTIGFAAYHKIVSWRVAACRKQGLLLYTGPFIAAQ